MVSSAFQAMACILLLIGAFVPAGSQTVPEQVPTGTISGRVTLKGKGTAGVTLRLILMESAHPRPTRHWAITDKEGDYRIINVPPGKYRLDLLAPSFAPAKGSNNEKPIVVGKNEIIEHMDFALSEGGVITGKVAHADGHPIMDEEISIFAIPSDGFPISRNVRTDDRGIYRAFGVPAGKYRVSAGQGGDGFLTVNGRASYRQTFHPNTAEVSQAAIVEVTEGGEATNVDITLGSATPTYTASGRIVDGETGSPIPNARYGMHRFFAPGGRRSIPTGKVTNKDGEFKLENLSPGSYAVFMDLATDDERRAEPLPFEVIDQDVTGLIVKTSNGASASGVIVFEGTNDKSAFGMSLSAFVFTRQSINSAYRSARIEPDGSFRFAGLPPGTLNFGLPTVRSAVRFGIVRIERHHGVVNSRGLEIKEADQITGLRIIVSQANGTIRGVVKLDKGAFPSDTRVLISLRRIIADDSGVFSGNVDSPEMDIRGQFVAEYLLPGTYEVTATYFGPSSQLGEAKQQVVVTNGAVSNVTLTINTSTTPARP